MTEEIIKLSIENKSYCESLEFVPTELMTDEIVKLAIKNNMYGNPLKYVPINLISECKAHS
jgi:hypothetical protein